MRTKLVHLDNLSVEANVRRMANGNLLLVCTSGGVCEPAIENRVYYYVSEDDGITWSDKKQLGEEDGLSHYHTETDIDGNNIKVFVSVHNGKFVNWKNYVYESNDFCETWTKKELEALPEYAFVRSKAKLSNGKVIYPYHYYPITKENEAELLKNDFYVWKNSAEYIESGFLESEDNCTFKRKVCFKQYVNFGKNDKLPRWFWPENTIVELENGHLFMYMRVDATGYLWKSESFDYGDTWSEPTITDIPNPSNKPQLLKADDGKTVLINTPNSTHGLVNRNPLELWIFEDNLKTLSKKIRISDFDGAYSYTNGFIENNKAYLAFEFNRHDVYFAVVDLLKD